MPDNKQQISVFAPATGPRGWRRSGSLALLFTVIVVVVSAVVNPFFNRIVHWDIMTYLAITILLGSTLMLRYRRL
jgi:hypothetical protein